MRDGGVERVGHSIRNDFASIFVTAFRKFREQIRGWTALNEMIRHDAMNDIFSATFRHVASNAVRGGRMRGSGHGAVALVANSVVTIRGGWAMRNIVRIVTSSACQCAFTFQEALRFAQAVGGTDDLKFVVILSGRVIEEEDEIRERLAGTVRVGCAIVSTDGVGKGRAGGF